jgi:hypothetical protein
MNGTILDHPSAAVHLPLVGSLIQSEAPARRAVGEAVTQMCLDLQDHWPIALTAGSQYVTARTVFMSALRLLCEDEAHAQLTAAEIYNLLEQGRR